MNKWLPWVILLGCSLAVVAWYWVSTAVPLTRERLDAARARWRAAKVLDYDYRVTVAGRTRNVHLLEVRGGKITSARQKPDDLTSYEISERTPEGIRKYHVDSLPYPNPWLAEAWTVEGVFDEILENDLVGMGERPTFTDVLFDTELGYPKRYVRSGPNLSVVIDAELYRRNE
jgi:hypothetical protein